MQDSTTPTKPCRKCKAVLPLDDFPKVAACKDGHAHTCRDCKKVRARERYAADPVAAREKQRAKNSRNPQMARQSSRTWWGKNREGRRNYKHDRREQLGDAWFLLRREHCARKRARRLGVAIEPVDYAEILRRDGYFCHICKSEITPQTLEAIEFDHVTPMQRGGAHSTSNIAVAHLSCNKRKYNKTLRDFAERLGSV